MSDTKALLDEVAKLQAAQDAGALLGLEDHTDKKVRKAARKAIHVLRSKGVEIPEQGRAWVGASLQDLRSSAGAVATVDMAASPGVTRLTLSLPDDSDGARLYIGIIDPNDRLVDFAAYFQTDGQQVRMARDWNRDSGGREVSADWARARLVWAREQTFRANFDVPANFDEHLPTLLGGDAAPTERPALEWLEAALEGVEPSAADLGGILMSGAVHTWPLLFDAKRLFQDLSDKMEGVEPKDITEADRLAHIMSCCEGDEALRKALAGPFARALGDVAVVLWLDGSASEAARVLQLVRDISTGDKPEMADGVVNLVQLQITAAAMEQMRQGGDSGDHDHGDHDHDHDHGDHSNCDHD